MWRLARAGLRARPGQAVWQFVLGVLAIGAAVAATLYADGAAAETQRLRYASAEGADRAITIRGSVAAGGGLVQAERLADTLGAIGARAGLRAYGTVELDAATLGGAQAGSVQLVAREGACDNLRVSGRCPAAAGEALAAADVSGATGVAAGGRLLVQAPGAAPVRLRVVGTYRAGDDASAYWAGRDDFAADGRLTATPVIVQPATIVAARPKTVKVRIDLVAADPAGVSGDAGVVTDVLADVRRALPVAFTVEPGLVPLVRGAATDREVLRTGIVVGASQLVALCCLVLLLAAAAAATDRRPESALTLLRGAPRRHWAAVAMGPTVLALAAAGIAGYGLGWLAAWAAWRTTLGAGVPPAASRAALLAAGVAVLLVFTVAVGAEWAAQRGKLLDNLRRTPARRGGWRPAGVDLVVLALAAAAGYQLLAGQPTGGLAAVAPLLLTLACALVAGRVALPVAARLGTALLHRGRLAPGLAAIDVARRPHARQLLTVVAVAVALAGMAVCGADTTARAVDDRAALELGAARVLTVGGGPAATRLAVHAADPAGRWAMAAARRRVGRSMMVAVEADRLAAVARWPATGPDPAELARALRPAGNAPVRVRAGELVVDASVTTDIGAPTLLRLRLVEPAGAARDAVVALGPRPGRRDYRVAVPGCAAGCRLAWLQFTSSPEHVRLHAVRQRDPEGEREVVAPRDFATPGRWRAGFTARPGELRTSHGDGWLSAAYRPLDPRFVVSDLRVLVADAPVPVPVVAGGGAPANATALWTLSTTLRPVEVVGSAAGLPGAGLNGFLFDHEYAERVAGDLATTGTDEVWLAADVPPAVLARLRATLPVRAEQTVEQRAERLLDLGAGQAVQLHVLAALIGLGLAVGGVSAVAGAERRRRAGELRALRRQGLPAAVVARSGWLGYAAMVGGGLLVGLAATTVNWWATRRLLPAFADGWAGTATPGAPRPLLAAFAFAAVAALLLAAAGWAARRLAGEVR